ncbi:MAG: phage major capsid protein [Actinobacteria bacterium]|nr:phage major capsid protein [Actinomycetota bacterium]
MIDSRTLEDRAARLQSQVKAITRMADRDGAIPESKRDELMRLTGEIGSLEQLAKEAKNAELAELRAIVRNGEPPMGHAYPTAEAQEYLEYLRAGTPMAASITTTDTNGGYLVPEPLHAELIEKIREIDPIVRLAHRFDLSGGDTKMQLPFKATHGAVANATETGARSEQDAPTFTSPVLEAFDYYTDQRATQTAVDSIPGFENMLLGWIVEDIWEQAGVDFAVGDGNTKAAGLFAATATYPTMLSGAAGAIEAENFLEMFTALHPRYRPGAAWLMTSATLAVASAFTYPGTGNTTPLVDWTGGEPKILGKPVYESSSAPEIGAANYPVAFGDVGAGYAIGLHRTPGILRDPYTVTPYIRYYGLARIGGCPWDSQAVLLLKSNDA